MKYILLIYDDEQLWGKLTESERKQMMGEYMQFSEGIRAAGKYQAG